MKLLKKTNRTFFIISALALFMAGLVIYFVISYFFEDQLDEQLLSDRMSIIRNIENEGTVPEFKPFIEVKKTSDQLEKSVEYSDTMIFDVNEKENIPFRQMSSAVKINGDLYLITVRDTLLEKGDILMIIGVIIAVTFVLLNIILYFINRKLSLVIWKPFYQTLNDLRKFSHDAPDFKLSTGGDIDEFIELNKTLDNLTSRVKSDYLSLKRFTEDASHEIQSPLSVIQSKLETLIQYPDLNNDQAVLIKSAYISVQRISKLIKTLLLLTKIENDQFPGKKAVNISELIEGKIRLFDDMITEKLLILKNEIKPEYLIETNLILADSLIQNLIGNAVKHCTTGGIINIQLSDSYLEISNSGDPLPVESTKLFDRFYKVNPSSESPGLGLSIVREICIHYNWKIEYYYSDHKHNFRVVF